MNQRVGRKITIKSVYLRGFIGVEKALQSSAAFANAAMHTRLIIFTDMQPNGAAPAMTDLLVTADSSSHLNINNRDRFKIHVDKEWVFDPYWYTTTATQAVASGGRQIWSIKKYKKLNQEVVFSTSTGAIADITTGALYMFWIGTAASGSTDANAVVSTRVRYTDI